MATEAELLAEIARLEDELRRSRDEAEETATILDVVLRQMPGIYWVVDRDLRILRSGGGSEGMLGVTHGRFQGHTIGDVAAADPMNVDTVTNHRRAIAGELIHVEAEYRGKLLATVIGPYRRRGEIVGAIGMSMDVTTWRLLERRMVDAQRAESLGVLAGGLAHDFNNLLVAVLGNADRAIRQLDERNDPRADIENIRTAGMRAAELTEQLLAYSGRGPAGTTRVTPGLVVEELLRILAPSMPAGIDTLVDLPLELAVRGDPAQLRQVLLNLINNARDALGSRGGTIHIRGSAEHITGEPHPHDILAAPAGAYAVLEVADSGPGMDAETRRHVFEPFFTTKQRGHGLGLAAVLGIVRAHGGGIRLISSPGVGATFQVLWPASTSAPVRTTPPPNQRSSGRTVLVIDDEDLVRDVVARMVEDLGYTAMTAADGKTALDLVARETVDAVLVDLTMPVMSGADVIAALRERRPSLPIVVCSGYDRDGRGPATADAYLPKPFRIDALERTLAKLLPLRNV